MKGHFLRFKKFVSGILIPLLDIVEKSCYTLWVRETDRFSLISDKIATKHISRSRLRLKERFSHEQKRIGSKTVSQHQGNPRTHGLLDVTDGITDNSWWWWMIWETRREYVTRNDAIFLLNYCREILLWFYGYSAECINSMVVSPTVLFLGNVLREIRFIFILEKLRIIWDTK